MISDSVMNLMMELITLSFVIPVVLIAVWKMRTRASLMPVLAGAVTYLVFAVVLQSVPDMIFLQLVHQNIWLQTLYTAVTTALLGGIGTYLAFRYFLTKYPGCEAAVSYGLGYACLDCIAVLGIGNIQNYTFAQMINRKQIDALLESVASDRAAVASYQALVKTLKNMDRMELILSGVEQLLFLFLQTALAILIFYAVRKAGQIRYLWIAMAMQALVIFLTAFYKTALLSRLPVLLCILILTAGVIRLAFRLYKSFPKQEKIVTEKHAGWEYAGKKLNAEQEEDVHE